jgi:hypothetical protein
MIRRDATMQRGAETICQGTEEGMRRRGMRKEEATGTNTFEKEEERLWRTVEELEAKWKAKQREWEAERAILELKVEALGRQL